MVGISHIFYRCVWISLFGYAERTEVKLLERIFTSCLVLVGILIVGLITWNVTIDVMGSATGEQYTEEKWFIAEQYVCAKQGLEAQQYIGQSCSLFGCVDREKTKCVGHNIEKKIDYEDPIFCQYSMKEDFGWC